jgi:CRP-like cAMP-binding protein
MAEASTRYPPATFLAELGEAERSALLETGRRMVVPDGSTLLFEGDTSGRVVVLLAGAARVFATAANGREVLLNVIGPGEMLGEVSALDGAPHSASATALGVAEVVFLDAGAFRLLLDSNATVAEEVARTLARSLRRVERHRVELAAYDVPTRLAGTLVDLADRLCQDRDPVELPVSQRELAEWCGASREAVTKALKGFRSRGWVRTDTGSVTVLDRPSLRQRAP